VENGLKNYNMARLPGVFSSGRYIRSPGGGGTQPPKDDEGLKYAGIIVSINTETIVGLFLNQMPKYSWKDCVVGQ